MKKHIIILAIISNSISFASASNRNSTDFYITGKTIPIISIETINDLNFGDITTNGVTAGTAIIGLESSTTTGIFMKDSHPMQLKLLGEANASINLSFPNSINLINTDTNKILKVKNINCTDTLNKAILTQNIKLSPSGENIIKCGAELEIPENSTAGLYNGSINININY